MMLIKRLFAQSNMETDQSTASLLREAAEALALALSLAQPEQDTVTVRYDLASAKAEEAIKNRLIELGWTPPLSQPPPQQAPVPVFELEDSGWEIICDGDWIKTLPVGTKLYTYPPAILARKPLSDEEAKDCLPKAPSTGKTQVWFTVGDAIKAIRNAEAAHGIKETQ